MPQLQGRGARQSRAYCPGKLGASTALDSAGYCDSLWPSTAGEPCAAYVIGVGGHWTFARYALSKGCVVHAYDPTVELRRRHQRDAARMNGTYFHFAGLGGDPAGVDAPEAARAGSTNSYGSIDNARLMTLPEMLASRPPGAAPMRVLTIDCEGCEWAAFEHLARNASAARALQSVGLLHGDDPGHKPRHAAPRRHRRAAPPRPVPALQL